MICDDFKDIAKTIWLLRQASEAHGLSLGEETLTDIALLYLATNCSSEVKIAKFNRHQESRTGADWEWWFTDGISWFGMLVQAKRLYLPSRDYKSIKQKVGGASQRQIDLLIKMGKRRALTPIYCFYNYLPNAHQKEISWGCSNESRQEELFGCSIAHAAAIQANLGDISIKNISAVSLPWHCLTCCTSVAGWGRLPFRANSIVRELASKVDAQEQPYVSTAADSPPDHIRLLSDTDQEHVDQIIPRLQEYAESVAGIVIVQSD